jgi:hypothetical protein
MELAKIYTTSIPIMTGVNGRFSIIIGFDLSYSFSGGLYPVFVLARYRFNINSKVANGYDPYSLPLFN